MEIEAFYLSLALLAAALLCGLIGFLRSKHLEERLLVLDFLSLSGVGIITLAAWKSSDYNPLDLILVFFLVLFIGVVVFARTFSKVKW